MSAFYTLREIFQLKNTRSLRGRPAAVRLFRVAGQWGVTDDTGALWPLHLAQGSGALHEPKESDRLLIRAFNWEGGADGVLELNDWKIDTAAMGAEWGVPHQRGEASSSTSFLCKKWRRWLVNSFSENSKRRGTTHFFPPPFSENRSHSEAFSAKRFVSSFFRNRNYLEIDAPLLVESGGMERYLNPFCTDYIDHKGKVHPLQLPTSPEFALKKVVAKGSGRVFSLAPSFRNGGESSRWHRPQFTMLEWYTVGQSLQELIGQTHELICGLAQILGSKLSLPPKPLIFRIDELYQKYFGLDLQHLSRDKKGFYEAVQGKAVSVRKEDDWDLLFWKSFLDVIEPAVRKETLVYLTGFPSQFASLAAVEGNGVFAQRFEAFLCGIEICNGYHELTSCAEMERRFRLLEGERTDLQRDHEFEAAMAWGLPSCSGNALGLERLISLMKGHAELSQSAALEAGPVQRGYFQATGAEGDL